MRNILILGTARSGTSMVAATFRFSGAFMGDQLIRATSSNPYGYYEDRQMNRLNNGLIRRLLGPPFLGWRIRNRIFRTVHSVPTALFMAAPQRFRDVELTGTEVEQIRSFVRRQPFCYKDPRFSATLQIWLPYLPKDTGMVVVFRDPMRTAESMIRDANEQYDPPLPVSENWAYICWQRTYSRLLQLSNGAANWLFVNYDQMLDGTAASVLCEFVGAQLDFSQVNSGTSRSSIREWPRTAIAQRCLATYRQLCERANLAQVSASNVNSHERLARVN